MDIEIITKNFQLDIYGFGGIATNKDYAGTAFKLSGKMWELIKASDIKNKGMNICITTTAKTDAEALALLKHLGMPFRTQ